MLFPSVSIGVLFLGFTGFPSMSSSWVSISEKGILCVFFFVESESLPLFVGHVPSYFELWYLRAGCLLKTKGGTIKCRLTMEHETDAFEIQQMCILNRDYGKVRGVL